MKRITRFWQKLVSGELVKLKDFTSTRRAQAKRDYQDQAFMRLAKPAYDVPNLKVRKHLLRTPTYFVSDKMLQQHARADWQNTEAVMRKFAGKFLLELRRQNFPAYALWAFRTEQQQNKKVKEGRSSAKGVRAPHPQGKAFDWAHSTAPWDIKETGGGQLTLGEYAQIGRIGYAIAREMGISVKWGGEFKTLYDPHHWELTDWRDDIRLLPVGEPIRLTPKQLEKF